MSSKKARNYRSELRQRQAADTRSRVLAAAAEVFAAEGFAGTTIAQIAERAGVAVATVQKQGSKPALLRAAAEVASFGVEGNQDVLDLDIGRAFLALGSVEEVPDFLGAAYLAINAAAADLWPAITHGASTDAELSAFHAELLADIRRQDERVLGVLRDRGWLRTDVPFDEVLESLCVLSSVDGYVRFVRQDGLPDSAYARFVARVVRESILVVSARPTRRPLG